MDADQVRNHAVDADQVRNHEPAEIRLEIINIVHQVINHALTADQVRNHALAANQVRNHAVAGVYVSPG